MADGVSVRVIRRRSRQHYTLRWKGGEVIAKAKWGDDRAAWEEAFALEAQLNAPNAAILSWDAACQAYEDWHLAELSLDHQRAWQSTRRAFERWKQPPPVNRITNATLADFATSLKLADSTVRTYCRYLTGFFRWCKYMGWIDNAPEFRLARRKRGENKSRGRPLTGEEFDRMIAAIPLVVGDDNAPSWEFLVRGLWLSSLRLSEAVALHWTNGPVRVNLERRAVEFIDGDKGGHGGLPIVPEWLEVLSTQPQRGYVFRPQLSKGTTRSRDTWSHKIGDFGEAAGIIVKEGKFASAHDLRRSFSERWRSKVSMEVLQQLMRHKSSETTRQYYLGDALDSVIAAIYG